jgi:hypothetical protein
MNAKEEFILHTRRNNKLPIVLCATLNFGREDGSHNERVCNLTTGYTDGEYLDFLKSLDIEYDSGYGSQELYGVIWYKDGTWSTRGEYDGSEWWESHSCPTIPDEIRCIDKEREEKLNSIIK